MEIEQIERYKESDLYHNDIRFREAIELIQSLQKENESLKVKLKNEVLNSESLKRYWDYSKKELKDKEEIIEKFQELTKERDVYFHQDDEDGYFIKVSDKGSYNKQFEVAELEDMKCNNILTAMENAIEYMKRKDSDFENLLNRFNK